MKPLTPELVNTLIRRIDIRAPIKVNGKRTVAVDIRFTVAGLFTVPNANEITASVSEISMQSA